MKWGKAVIIALLVMFLTACNKEEAQQPIEEPQQENPQIQNEVVAEEPKEVEEIVNEDHRFPVPIYKDGEKVVSIDELPEATQAALQWAYDFFNTKGIETEEEFYQLMKAKYRGEVNADVDTLELQFAGYGREMLPAFTPNQIVESFVVYPEVPVGLSVKVPAYIQLKGKENMHAIAISYSTHRKEVNGVDPNFPMALD